MNKLMWFFQFVVWIGYTKYSNAEGVDFTCYSDRTRLDIDGDTDGDTDTYIGGFMSGTDIDASVTFDRTYETGAGSGLPSRSYEEDHDTLYAKLLQMPTGGGNVIERERFGAFKCVFSKGGATYSITTLIQDEYPFVESRSFTITANYGENVTLRVETGSNLRWWHNNEWKTDWSNLKSVDLPEVDDTDAGVYECHQSGQRISGVHALMRLIVRACPSNLWGPSCSNTCRICYNGGMCSDVDGSCICAPGFSGAQCAEVHGSNVFGQDGHLKCDVNEADHGNACEGRLFCMPDPFGCSCAAGYMGRECTTACDAGTFGADCKQNCHCKIGCLPDTGECVAGDECQDGWTGVNCQESSISSITVTSPSPSSLTVSWTSAGVADSYQVDYQLIQKDQCGESGDRTTYVSTTGSSIEITGLSAYSTYTVFVKPITSDHTCVVSERNESTITTAVAPNGPPSNVQNSSRTNTSLTIEWMEVACGYRGGSNEYMYELNDDTGKQISTGTTAKLNVTISGLIPCTIYNFKVKAYNGAGDGVFSELINCATDISELGPVRLLTTDEITSDTWTASWSPQDEMPCPADEYFVEYALLEPDNCKEIENPEIIEHGRVSITSATITGLHPYSMYEMYVYASNDLGRGERMSIIDYTEESEPSGPPTTIHVLPDKHSIEYSWEEPTCGNRSGTIQYYSYKLTPGELEGVSYVKNVTLDKLNPCSTYTLAISAATSVGEGPQDIITATTEKEVPLQPSNLWLTNKGLRELSVQWDKPDQIFCPIISYTITIRTVYKPYDDEFIPKPDPDEEIQTLPLFWTFEDLSPSTEYEIKACANGEIGPGEFVVRHYSTSPADEEDLGEPLPRPNDIKSNDTTVTVRIPQITGAESEFITEFKIYVESLFALANSPDPENSYEAGSVLKTEVKDGPKDFIVGSGTEQNPPLEPEKKYRIFIGSCSVIKNTGNCIWSEPIVHGKNEQVPHDDTVLIVAVSLLTCFLVASVAINIGIVMFKKRSSNDNRNLEHHEPHQQVELDPYTNLGHVAEPTPYEDMITSSDKPNWTIPWSHLELSNKILGKGSFGKVREGVYKKGSQIIPVAVKTLNSKATTSGDKTAFHTEFETMKRIGRHPNVVSLIGACEHEGVLYVALEYLSVGDLRTYLRTTRRRNQKGVTHQLPPKKLLQLAFDVARGMEHLSNIGIIHRDLAARNILLDDELVAKVSDFGMSRGENVYVKTSKQRVPTRWLAMESLCYNKYTTKSDVWSYGVLLWEIATLGATPYAGIATRHLSDMLSDGYRMAKPASLDNAVYDLMTECWHADPEQRPSFSGIGATLNQMLKRNQHTYVDTTVYENVKFPAIEPERDDN